MLYHTSDNDMHLPIKYAMEFPNLVDYNESNKAVESLDLFIQAFNLQPIDEFRYAVMKFTKMSNESLKFLGTIITTCNDYLVELFLNNQILYTDIYRITEKVVEKYLYQFEHLKFTLKNIEHVNKIILKEVKKCSGK